MGSIRRAIGAAPPALSEGEGFRRFVAAAVPGSPAPVRAAVAAEEAPSGEDPASDDGVAAVVSEALRFRAALREAFAGAFEALCSDLAARVLARELRAAPCEIAAIAARVLEHRDEEGALALRAAADDLPALEPLARSRGLMLRADERLRPGDVALEVRTGSIECTLALRADAVLRAHERTRR